MSEQREKGPYHHGALRDELLTSCLSMIDSEGLAAVSVRRVAREAGVSSGAPYHHFPDRASMFVALSVRGFEDLNDRLRRAVAQAGTPQGALRSLVEAYVLFAHEQRAYFLLMFRPELTGPDKPPELHAAADEAFGILTDVLTDCQRAGVAPPGDLVPLATLVWAVAHGLAALWLDGPLEQRCEELGTRASPLTTDVAAALESLFSTRS